MTHVATLDAALAELADKFTEACIREHAIAPSPVYLAAAHDAVSRLAPH